uniref:YwmB family TATA-box binding protein n=1 Tax=Calditerricola satsumensis TaxID=373054 RepID=UPI000AD9DC03
RVACRRRLPAHLDIALRGEWTGKGQGDLREAATAAVLRALRATVVEAAVDDAMYSVSGTSPLLFGGVRTGGGEMNVQVAASRPQGDGGVGVTVGTPSSSSNTNEVGRESRDAEGTKFG